MFVSLLEGERYFLIFDDIGGMFEFEDYGLAKIIKLTTREYRDLLIGSFNAELYKTHILFISFKNKEDAQNACDFLNQSYKMLSW